MVNVKEDMTGWIMSEHGVELSKITVVEQAEDYVSKKGAHYAQWWCRCSCGNPTLFTVVGSDLRKGHTLSCGCFRVSKHKKSNIFELNFEDKYGLYGIGYCSNTGNKFYFDMEDYDKIKNYCWHERTTGNYNSIEAWEPKTQTKIKMQWLISDKYLDHKDRNALNNRKYNLRSATASQNSSNRSKTNRNTSGVIGVMWLKGQQKWVAHICVNNNKMRLGSFVNKDEAIKVRLKAEKKYFGEFAPQKHLFEEYGITTQNDCEEN